MEVRHKSASAEKPTVAPRTAVSWFLHDMAQASGYAIAKPPSAGRRLSGYAMFRPMLTQPDPWYFAGIVALEACKVCDLFSSEVASEVMREIYEQADAVAGREGNDVATLTMLIMGRLGLGTVLLRGKAPDSLLGKIMMILIGSETAAKPLMPAPEAHRQLRAALKLGAPVWWRMFRKGWELKLWELELDPIPLRPLHGPADSAAASNPFFAVAAE